MFLGSYLQQFGVQRQKQNDSTQRGEGGVSLSEAIKGRGVPKKQKKKSWGPGKEERVNELVIPLTRSLKFGKLALVVWELFQNSSICICRKIVTSEGSM